METIKLLKGDNRELLKTLEDNSIDSVVTDPPYGLSFMNKKWDYNVPSVELWKEVLRVLKPGGHVLSFGGTRTYHRMVVNMEDAGFEIRDSISYMYGSGFPKSHNIGKAIDKIQGNEREVVGEYETSIPQITPWKDVERFESKNQQTKGNSDWEGWGTSLKPSMELICLARKPLSEKSIAENVLKHGTGGINIDDCRVESSEKLARPINEANNNVYGNYNSFGNEIEPEGRFPANTILECICDEVIPGEKGEIIEHNGSGGIWNEGTKEPVGRTYNDKGDIHTNPECPCYILDKQSGNVSQGHWAKTKTTGFGEFGNGSSTYEGVGKKDKIKGGASRYFYTAKVSKKERNMGLDETPDKILNRVNSGGLEHDKKWAPTITKNNHPTVKPINLMTYLCRLITPPNGVVLDMYMGSGSTGISALLEGFKFVGMEMDDDYFNIAEARINNFEQYRQFIKK